MVRKLIPIVGGIVALAAAFTWWRTEQSVQTSRQQIRNENQIQFTLKPWIAASSSGFEPISAAATFLDAASFSGKLYVASSNSLLEYAASPPALNRSFRAGLELPSAPITALAVGPALDGTGERLYVATNGEGILIFDGQSFVHLHPEQAPVRSITALASTGLSGLLVGTKEAGVFRFDGHGLSWLHPNLQKLKVTALAGDIADLWIGTRDKGVGHFLAGQLSFTAEAEGLPDSQVLSLAITQQAVYAGTPSGVALFRGGKFDRVVAPGFFARSLAIHSGGLWVGTLEEGIINVPLNGRVQTIPFAADVRRIVPVGPDWLAVTRSGIFIMAKSKPELLLKAPGAILADGNISALSFDSSGRLWVGYFDKGLDVIAADFQSATHVETDSVFCVNRLLVEPNRQRITVATANGLVFLDSSLRIRQTLLRANGLIANHVTDVVPTETGLALATPSGITFLEPNGTRSIYAFHGLVNNHVYALSREADQLIVGTLGGLSILEKDTVKANLTSANSGLKHNWITAIASVGKQHYIGSYGGGVVKLNPTLQIETFPDMPKDLIINPNAMLVTAKAVYVGTLGRGLGVYNRKQERWRFVEFGLPSPNVTAFAINGDTLYIGTENGLVRVPEKNLEF